jgi:putative flippase GtrA
MTILERQPISQSTTSPTMKVAAGGSAGAVTVVLVYILAQFNLVVPADVASAVTVIFTFLTSYFIKERPTAGAPANQAGDG